MGIEKALEIFRIENIDFETDDTLKKKYRTLMKENHPDVTGDTNKAQDIGKAYSILKNVLKQLNMLKLVNKQKEVLNIILPLHKLIDIYNGESVSIKNNDTNIVITKETLNRHNVLILSELSLRHNNVDQVFTSINTRDLSDTYEIQCEIYVTDITSEETVGIKIEDKVKTLKIKSQSLRLRLVLNYNINVEVLITKKIRDDNT